MYGLFLQVQPWRAR